MSPPGARGEPVYGSLSLTRSHILAGAAVIVLVCAVFALQWFVAAARTPPLGSPVHDGIALVTRKSRVQLARYQAGYMVVFRLDGRTVPATTNDHAKWAYTAVGARLPVRYQVVRNGDYVIVDWQTGSALHAPTPGPAADRNGSDP